MATTLARIENLFTEANYKSNSHGHSEIGLSFTKVRTLSSSTTQLLIVFFTIVLSLDPWNMVGLAGVDSLTKKY